MSKTEGEAERAERYHCRTFRILPLNFTVSVMSVLQPSVLWRIPDRIDCSESTEDRRDLCWDDLSSLTFQNSRTLREFVLFMSINLKHYDLPFDWRSDEFYHLAVMGLWENLFVLTWGWLRVAHPSWSAWIISIGPGPQAVKRTRDNGEDQSPLNWKFSARLNSGNSPRLHELNWTSCCSVTLVETTLPLILLWLPWSAVWKTTSKLLRNQIWCFQ